MIKYIYTFFLAFFVSFSFIRCEEFNIKHLPLHENGRVKPLDTFLKNQLLILYGKRTLKSSALPENFNSKKLNADDWFFDLILNPEEASKYKVFNISNPELVSSLGLDWSPAHRYNINEVLTGLQIQFDYISAIQQKPKEELTPFDQKLLQLYNNAIQFQQLTYSLSCLTPSIIIQDSLNAKRLNIKEGDKLSYFQLMKKATELGPIVNNLVNKNKTEWTKSDYELQYVLTVLNEIDQDKFANNLKIIPPEDSSLNSNWLSPWELMDGREIGPNQKLLLDQIESYLKFRINDDEDNQNFAINNYKNTLLKSFNHLINIDHLKLETWLNKFNIFYKSVAFYLLSFILLLLSWIIKPKMFQKIALSSIIVGLIFHFIGILCRMIIMQRPPVSTLYESILFVGIISVIFSLILEINRKDGIGIFIGSIIGSILHFVGFGYANDGDTLEVLVAVLNSNFWLSTHVTTITIGYGASLFAGLIGHVYLLQIIINPSNSKLIKNIHANLFGATLFALFFTLFGTILGGIWADQSWGRFWGWDPKENGALLIVMWQIMMLHLRLTGLVKPLGFALGMVLNNIVVILAWFGVNLLSIGLHSYGFAEGIAINITLFVTFELITGFGTYYWAKKKFIK